MQNINANELAAWLDDESRVAPLLLDVREPWEYELCHIGGSTSMPMSSVPANHSGLDSDKPTVCICHHGIRSMQVAAFLDRQGFSEVINLTGGIDAWAMHVDRSMPTY